MNEELKFCKFIGITKFNLIKELNFIKIFEIKFKIK